MEVGFINTTSVLESMLGFPSVEEFLRADMSIGIHSTTVPHPESTLSYELDIDGICVEIQQLEGLKAGLDYLLLPRLRLISTHYAFIKKQVDLRSNSNEGLTALKNAMDHTVAYVDGGYSLILTALPVGAQLPDGRLHHKDLCSVLALAILNKVVKNFQDLLRKLPPRTGCEPPYTNRAPQRHPDTILSLPDRPVAKANECHFLKVVFFLNQFGQKQVEPLDISHLM